ncbi:MAG: peptidylprolyl isomerase [Alphaproteobacteria bacterium]
MITGVQRRSVRGWLVPAVLLMAALAAWSRPAPAQDGTAQNGTGQTLRIVAVVNDEIVTEFDVAARMQLIIRSSGLPDTQETRNRLATQILRQLIDERVQMQEARRLGVEVLPEELERALAQLERENNIPEGQLEAAARQMGIPFPALLDRITVDLTWQKLQAQRIRPTIEITNDEIEEVLSRIVANQGATEYRVAEIYLSVDSPDREEETRAAAQQLLDELARGASFSALARQFSQSASAAVGGDLGWIYPGLLDPAIDELLPQLSVGEVSTPVRTANGYFLIAVIDRRSIAGPSPGDVRITFQVITLPLTDAMSATEQASQRDLAKTVAELAGDCSDMSRLSIELGLGELAPPITRSLVNIADNERRILEGLVMQRPSDPIEEGGTVSVYMVCAREAPEGALPPREEIEDNLLLEKTNVLAQRLLRDLRQAAFIDVRV